MEKSSKNHLYSFFLQLQTSSYAMGSMVRQWAGYYAIVQIEEYWLRGFYSEPFTNHTTYTTNQ